MKSEPTARERFAILFLIATFFSVTVMGFNVSVVKDWETAPPAFPTVRSIGSVVNKGAAITLSPPSGVADGDLLLAFVETANETAITATDWTSAPCSPSTLGASCPGDPDCTSITILYNNYDTGDNWTTNDSGNHQIGVAMAINAGTWDEADPFDICVADSDSAGKSVVITGGTTTIASTLVIAASGADGPDANKSTEFSGEANADLGSVNEEVDTCKNTGNGGCILVVSGTKASAGSFTDTTSTAADFAARAYLTLTINSNP